MSSSEVNKDVVEQQKEKGDNPKEQNPDVDPIAPKQESLLLPPPDMIMATSNLSTRNPGNAEKPPVHSGGFGHSITNYRFLDRNITESLDHLM